MGPPNTLNKNKLGGHSSRQVQLHQKIKYIRIYNKPQSIFKENICKSVTYFVEFIRSAILKEV